MTGGFLPELDALKVTLGLFPTQAPGFLSAHDDRAFWRRWYSPPEVTTLALLAAALLPIPLSPGTWWEYRETYTERIGALDSIQDDTTRFAVGGRVAAPFIHQSGGADPVSGPVRWGDDWISLAPWTGEERLPLPLEPGRAGPPPAPGLEAWTVEERQSVTVPAGTFEALRCALRTRRLHSVLWIAPSVGVVREQHGEPGRRPEIERVLLRWSGASRPASSETEGQPEVGSRKE